MLGLWRHIKPRAGVFWHRRLLHGDVFKLESSDPQKHQNPIYTWHSRLYGLEPNYRLYRLLGAFHSLPFTLGPYYFCPLYLRTLLVWPCWKRRVGGVYFQLLPKAVASILTILIIGQQGYTGGVNGITDLRTF